MHRSLTPALAVLCALPLSTRAFALSPEELAKLAQNPIGNLVSIPFQNNTDFERPEGAARWQLRFQVQLMFPKSLL